MKAYIISDGDYNTAVYKKMAGQVEEFLSKRDFQIEQKSIKKGGTSFLHRLLRLLDEKAGRMRHK